MRTAQLADVCEVVMGQAPPGDSYNDAGRGFPLVAGAGDMKAGRVVPTKYTTAPTKLSRPGDVIIGIRASIGMRAQSSEEVCLGRGVAALRPGTELDRGYLWHWIEASASRLAAKGRGATFLQVGRQDIAEMEIPLPPLDEQRRIARVLDIADGTRGQRRQALALLHTLRHSLLASRFGDPLVTVGDAHVISLRELMRDIRIGPFGSALHKEDYVSGGVPVINPMHILDGHVVPDGRFSVAREKWEELEAYTLRQGDVILGRRGEMGRCAVIGKPEDGFLCGTGSMILRPDPNRSDPVFLQAVLSSRSVRHTLERSSLGATLPNLNKGIVGSLKVRVPDISEQKAFARAVRQLGSVASIQTSHAAALDSLFASLQERAFNGDL